MGLMYGIGQDDNKAVYWYEKSAKQGHIDGQFYLGWIYDEGLGVEIDDEQPMYCYQQSAKQGHAKAQNNLGNMYHTGKAIHLYDQAVPKGILESQYNVGLLYFLGRGLLKIIFKRTYGCLYRGLMAIMTITEC